MRVLLVEDEAALAETVRRGLTNEGFVVDVAHDGITGQWMATENPYDVIVLDIMLPGRNGYDVLRNLRALKIWAPTLMLTAKDGEYDQTDAFELGADDYLTKPFSFMVLVARLRALVRRGAPARPVTLTVGDLELDPNKRTVCRAGHQISLTAREFAVLHYLMRHPEMVLSKAEILENVWDPAFDGSENIVEVYVGYLRRKIDSAFGVVSVETVRGMGYRLMAVTATS
jgi:DNA-binding response OmpR family regulator